MSAEATTTMRWTCSPVDSRSAALRRPSGRAQPRHRERPFGSGVKSDANAGQSRTHHERTPTTCRRVYVPERIHVGPFSSQPGKASRSPNRDSRPAHARRLPTQERYDRRITEMTGARHAGRRLTDDHQEVLSPSAPATKAGCIARKLRDSPRPRETPPWRYR